MILTKRERLIVIVTALAVGAFVADRYLLTPLLNYREDLQAQHARAMQEMNTADRLLRQQRENRERWNQVTAAGLQQDPGVAESQALHRLRIWAQESRLPLTSLKPNRPTTPAEFQRITIDVVGAGSMNAISQFLWRIENADIPMRIVECNIIARPEGTDNLQMTLRLSTLYHSPPPPAPAPAGGTVAEARR